MNWSPEGLMYIITLIGTRVRQRAAGTQDRRGSGQEVDRRSHWAPDDQGDPPRGLSVPRQIQLGLEKSIRTFWQTLEGGGCTVQPHLHKYDLHGRVTTRNPFLQPQHKNQYICKATVEQACPVDRWGWKRNTGLRSTGERLRGTRWSNVSCEARRWMDLIQVRTSKMQKETTRASWSSESHKVIITEQSTRVTSAIAVFTFSPMMQFFRVINWADTLRFISYGKPWQGLQEKGCCCFPAPPRGSDRSIQILSEPSEGAGRFQNQSRAQPLVG